MHPGVSRVAAGAGQLEPVTRKGQSARARNQGGDPSRTGACDLEQFAVGVVGGRRHAARAHVPILVVAKREVGRQGLPEVYIVGDATAADRERAASVKRESIGGPFQGREIDPANIGGVVDVDRRRDRAA